MLAQDIQAAEHGADACPGPLGQALVTFAGGRRQAGLRAVHAQPALERYAESLWLGGLPERPAGGPDPGSKNFKTRPSGCERAERTLLGLTPRSDEEAIALIEVLLGNEEVAALGGPTLRLAQACLSTSSIRGRRTLSIAAGRRAGPKIDDASSLK